MGESRSVPADLFFARGKENSFREQDVMGSTMKSEMSAFDILALVDEAQVLVGGFVDKIFRWRNRKDVLIRFYVKEEGRKELYYREGKWLYFTERSPKVPPQPDNFATHLRRVISNARVTAVNQKEFDRIIIIDLQKEEDYRLIIELFGDGNLVLVKGDKIVNSLLTREWKDRKVRPGAEYSFPPQRFDPKVEGFSSFKERVIESDSDVVRTVATSINLGGDYGEEVALRAGVDKKRGTNSLDDEQIRALYDALNGIIDQVSEHPSPRVVIGGDEMKDATPVPLVQYEDHDYEEYGSFSTALENLLDEVIEEPEEEEDEFLERLKRRKEQQENAIDRLIEESEQMSAKAEKLYTNYQSVAEFLGRMKEIAEGSTWEELERLAKEEEVISRIDPSEQEVVLLLSGEEIPLNYTKSLEENASLIYEGAKERIQKSRRAEEAMRDTERKIEKRRKGLLKKKRGEEREPTKRFWFETYKWFITSSNRLVLAGRDARTNDQVVKKHLELGDRYAHSDIHGAPSIVIKEGDGASEEELREACIFAVCHSKAWNSGIREGSAYWVLPDQVSKSPQSGEFVPRGAFIIRGKRNYFRHLPMQLAVGEIEYEGERKIMCSPVRTMRGWSDEYVVISPGRNERNETSSLLSERFNVPEEEISRILPPGNLEIVETSGIKVEKE